MICADFIVINITMRECQIAPSITNREDPLTEKYLKDISKQPLLNTEEEIEAFMQIRLLTKEIPDLNNIIADLNEKYRGLTPEDDKLKKDYDKCIKKTQDDIKSKEEEIKNNVDKLVKANLRFVVSVAKQYNHYQSKGIKLQDLISEWNLWLAKAIVRFDETRWFKLISYAVWWIRQAILQYIAENSSPIKLPMNRVAYNNKYNKAVDAYVKKHWHKPSDYDLMEALNTDKEWLDKYREGRIKMLSWDAPWFENDEDESTVFERLRNDIKMPDEELEIKDMQHAVRKALLTTLNLGKISKKQYDIVTKYFGLETWKEKTFEEIAEEMDLSRERVRQLCYKALEKLRKVHSWKLLEALYKSL